MRGILKKKPVLVSCISAVCVLVGATVAILVTKSCKEAGKTRRGEIDISGEDGSLKYEGTDF